MRVIQTAAIATSDEALLVAFEQSLVRQDLSAATRRAYLSDLHVFQNYLAWLHEGRPGPLAQANTVDLAAFRKHLVQERGQRPATINRRVQSLKLFFRWLLLHGYINNDPAKQLRFMRCGSRTKPQALRRREFLALLHAARTASESKAVRNTALVQLMLQTGLRVGEVAALKREDVVIKNRSGVVRVREGKGMKAREVPLNLSARRALSAYLASRHDDLPSLFLSRRTGSLSIRGIQNVITKLAERAGIDRIEVSAHTLRHTFALHYLKSHPGKLVELSSLLGHNSLDTTAVYTRPAREELANDLETSALNVLGE